MQEIARKPNYDFNKDILVARTTEDQIIQYLTQKQDMEFLCKVEDDSEARLSDYDIKMKINKFNKIITIEIKEDFLCRKTGNVGVEYGCRGKPSGIMTSKSDFYVYKVHEPENKIGLYAINTNRLKDMIKENLYFRKVVGGDPGSNSKNYLFKLKVIKDNFKLLDYLEE